MPRRGTMMKRALAALRLAELLLPPILGACSFETTTWRKEVTRTRMMSKMMMIKMKVMATIG